MVLPSQVSYFMSKLMDSKRRVVRLTPQSSQTIPMNSSFTIRFPENAIVDLNNFNLKFTFRLKNTTGADQYVMVPASYKLWRQIVWRLNGQAVAGQSCDNYNEVYHALKVASVDKHYIMARKLQGEQLLTAYSQQVNNLKVAYDDFLNNGATDRYLVCDDWLLLARSPNYIDTAALGTLEATFYTAGTEIMKGHGAPVPVCDWELVSMEACVDVIELPQEYDAALSANLGKGGSIEIPFQNIVSARNTSGGTQRFNVSSQSLDGLIWFPLDTDYNSPETSSIIGGVQTSNITYEQNHFRYKLKNSSNAVVDVSNQQNVSLYWRVQGEQYPQQGAISPLEWNLLTNDTFGRGDAKFSNLLCLDSDATDGIPFYSLNGYLKNNCVGAIDLTVSGAGYSGQRICSGIDTRGASSQIELVMNNVSTATFVCMVALTTAVISAQAGQKITLLN